MDGQGVEAESSKGRKMSTGFDIYSEAIALGLKEGSCTAFRNTDCEAEVDHHESDLYLKHGRIANDIIAKYRARSAMRVGISTFSSKIDGSLWYEIPFGYTPFWDANLAKRNIETRRAELAREANSSAEKVKLELLDPSQPPSTEDHPRRP